MVHGLDQIKRINDAAEVTRGPSPMSHLLQKYRTLYALHIALHDALAVQASLPIALHVPSSAMPFYDPQMLADAVERAGTNIDAELLG